MTKSVRLAQVKTCSRRVRVGRMRPCLNRGVAGSFFDFSLTTGSLRVVTGPGVICRRLATFFQSHAARLRPRTVKWW